MAEALMRCSEQIADSQAFGAPSSNYHTRSILDLNGNRVGGYRLFREDG